MENQFNFAANDNDRIIEWTASGGQYQKDPDLDVLVMINKTYPDKTEALLLYALELAGLVKPVAEMCAPLEHTGLLPTGDPPSYPPGASEPSDLTNRIDDRSLTDLCSSEKLRNFIQQYVVDMINQWSKYSDEQKEQVWTFGKDYTARNDVPPVLRIIRVMTGRHPSEISKVNLAPIVSDDAIELAAGVYWMILREEVRARKHAEETVA